jgi:hypothetical protein
LIDEVLDGVHDIPLRFGGRAEYANAVQSVPSDVIEAFAHCNSMERCLGLKTSNRLVLACSVTNFEYVARFHGYVPNA